MTTDRAKDNPAKQTLVEGSERMSGLVRLGGALAVTVLLAVPVQAQSLKPWRQAMILPKADAGFFLMAAKRGFADR